MAFKLEASKQIVWDLVLNLLKHISVGFHRF
jgi:hypothetical protein